MPDYTTYVLLRNPSVNMRPFLIDAMPLLRENLESLKQSLYIGCAKVDTVLNVLETPRTDSRVYRPPGLYLRSSRAGTLLNNRPGLDLLLAHIGCTTPLLVPE